jgi:enoyl-CoA hydratase/carnithine racemase
MGNMENRAVFATVDARIAVLTFDDKDAKVNTWNDVIAEGFMDGIEYLRELIRDGAIDGVIIRSGKERNFHAGADLKSATASESRLEMLKRYEFFHAVMTKIASLKVPTLAAINGHALGGGMELALACDYRIARTSEKTQVGLPEVSIGRFPCYGGTQRLPRLIGLKAVELIMESPKLTAQQAFELGIVDRCISEEQDLLAEAKAFLKGILAGAVNVRRKQWDFSNIKAELKPYIDKYIGKETTLPAQELLINVFEEGLPASLYDGLEIEKKYRVKLADMQAQ